MRAEGKAGLQCLRALRVKSEVQAWGAQPAACSSALAVAGDRGGRRKEAKCFQPNMCQQQNTNWDPIL